ncbi:RLORF13A [Gallid alphaherpesvirus 2]|nr:RLORF13A [Gallid alphaherpesvirus 2]UOW62010.1 RLORF13A [Gallid alphaherpesvirus 2]
MTHNRDLSFIFNPRPSLSFCPHRTLCSSPRARSAGGDGIRSRTRRADGVLGRPRSPGWKRGGGARRGRRRGRAWENRSGMRRGRREMRGRRDERFGSGPEGPVEIQFSAPSLWSHGEGGYSNKG